MGAAHFENGTIAANEIGAGPQRRQHPNLVATMIGMRVLLKAQGAKIKRQSTRKR